MQSLLAMLSKLSIIPGSFMILLWSGQQVSSPVQENCGTLKSTALYTILQIVSY